MQPEDRAVFEAVEGVAYSVFAYGFDDLMDILGGVEVPVIEDIMPNSHRSTDSVASRLSERV